MPNLVFDRWPDGAEGVHTVWYYGGLSPIFEGNAVPDVDIWLRSESVRGKPPAFFRWPMPLTHAGLLPVGAKVSRGDLHARPQGQSKVFTISFEEGDWQYRCRSDWLNSGRMDPFGRGGYPLPPAAAESWWLEFALEAERALLVPCMEFLLRGYLRDKETLRKILLYRGAERDERLFGISGAPQSEDPWRVPLAHGIRNSDVVFLAHLRHDRYTQTSVRQLVSQMDEVLRNEARPNRPVKPVLLKTRPWFSAESVKVRVRGEWLEDEQTFVCLNLIGCSEPDGPAIEAEREKAEKVAATGPSDSDTRRIPRLVLMESPNAVELISHGEPGATMPTLAIEEEPFEILNTGTWRELRIRPRVRPARSSAPSPVDAGGLDGFGTGEPGSSKNLGRGSIYAPTRQNSPGMLDDMWRSFALLSERKKNFVRAVEVMDKEGNFNVVDVPEPHIGLLTKQQMSAGELKSNKRWALIDPGSQSPLPRAVMFVRLSTPKGDAYFVELERRVSTNAGRDENGASSDPSLTEHNQFCGLAFTLHGGHDLRFIEIATFILNEIVRNKGVMERVGKAFAEYSSKEIPRPRRFLAFKHTGRDEQRLYSDLIERVLGYLFSPTPT